MLKIPTRLFSSGLTPLSLSAVGILLLVTPAQASGWQYDMQLQLYFVCSTVGLFAVFVGFLAGRLVNIKSFALISLPISVVLISLSFVVGSAGNLISRLIFALQIVACVNGLIVAGMLAARCFFQQKTLLSDREHV